MRSNDDVPDTTGGELSTEDIAQPRTEEPPEPEEDIAGAPVYPGESVPLDEPAAEEATTDEAETEEGETEEGETEEGEGETLRLLPPEDEEDFRGRWQETQSRFVDDPRDAVHTADTLVADLMQTLAATFAQHKQELEAQWSQGEEADTEALRMALRRYRSFFNRLLST
ncbi:MULTISPECIES: hypothetical protein [Streptomyces]|uniref:Uncharacterized protein n=1 Tax=Streptomyces luteosporeus TaxID=173856 RepID=A0ABN3U1N1_9ACTN